MREFFFFLLSGLFLLCTGGIVPAATTERTAVLDLGPHERVVQTIRSGLDDGGKTVSETNTFVELRTGLNRLSDGAWVQAVAQVERVNGTLVARQTQHQVVFGDSADASNGTIDLLMINGGRFRVRPAGIAYTEFKDGQPGKSVFIAELQSRAAQLTASNQVTYFGALEYGDIAYDLSLSGLEQNVVFRQRLPKPQNMQMDPALVRIECWNEILEAPVPAEESDAVVRSDGSLDADVQLNFGPMQINTGRAYAINGAAADAPSVRVAKHWQAISNSVWLIESVPYTELAPLLAKLPAQQASRSIDRDKLRELWAKQSTGKRNRPFSLPEARSAQAQPRKDGRVALSTPDPSAPAVLLDWTLLSSATNAVLKGDTTYYVSGNVNLSATTNGATVIEGGTVVKFTNSTATARITITGPISCRTSAYRPAVFTSKDSDEIGEKITGSTGSPTNFYGQGLQFGGSNTLHDVRFAWLSQAVHLNSSGTLNLADAQLVRCDLPLYGESSATFNVENALCYACSAMMDGSSLTLKAWHLTLDQCTLIGNVVPAATLFLTNSVLASVSDWGFSFTNRFVDDAGDSDPQTGTVKTPNSFGDASEGFPFQVVGAGSHYLQSSNCTAQMHHTGTTNISAALLARLSQKTTYPPVVLTSNFTANTTLGPVVPRDDAGPPDVGFHYDPIDFAWSDLMVTNCTLTLTNGVAVAIYGVKGTLLHNGGKFVSEGDPIHLNHLTRYQTVQEQPVVWGGVNNQMELFYLSANSTPSPQVRLTYTDVSVMADAYNRRTLLLENASAVNGFAAYQSQLRGLYFGYSDSTLGSGAISWTNNLAERCTFSWTQNDSANPFTLSLYNNLFRNGTNTFTTANNSVGWTVKDNLFENANVSKSGTANVANSNNGYYPANALKLPASSGGDVTLTNVDYQTSFLGGFYYPASGTNLARLLNAGSRTASSAGLTSYTTTINQVADSGTVDIGYHYFAVNPNTTVTIQATASIASESGGPPGKFTVFRTGSTSANLTVYYKVGGTAVPGTDYQALSGSTVIGIGNPSQDITVTPIDNNMVTYHKTVTASLILTNSYFVGSPNQATVTISDNALPDDPVSVATLNDPSGIGYHPVNSSLIISRSDTTGSDKNFKRLNSSGVLSDWSTLTGLGYTDSEGQQGEIKLCIAQTTANGWTQGDLYFGNSPNPGIIGKITANGSGAFTNWSTLTNSSQGVGETDIFLGGLYIDQTGLFNGDMIVVSGSGGVWRVTASTNATKFAQINANGNGIGLEGVLTVANDPSKYGPWAGKILTCAESVGLVLAIDTNGVVTAYNLGPSKPEDLRMIPSGQNLYQADTGDRVLRYTADRFSSFAGDILVVDELADPFQCSTAGLYIVHWDGGRFVVRRLAFSSGLEHATFAPIGL